MVRALRRGDLTGPPAHDLLHRMPSAPAANAPHLPSNFDPQAYVYVGAFDSEPEPGSFFATGGFQTYTAVDGTEVQAANPMHADYLRLRELLDESPTSLYRDRGQCDHCGARIRYAVVLRHVPTGHHIAVGEPCAADSRVGSMDRATWQVKALRDAAQAARKAARTRVQRRANADAAPDVAEWLATHTEGWVPRSLFLLRRANEEGQAWDAAMVTVARTDMAAYDAEQARRDAERAAREARPTVPAPSGRTVVTGTIVHVKAQESDYGTTWKMLLEADPGFKVWSSIPKGALDAAAAEEGWNYNPMDLKGRRLTATINLEPKDDDPAFAWGSRPSKATLHPAGEAAPGA